MRQNPPDTSTSESPTAVADPMASNERLVRLHECLQAVSLGRTAWLDLVKEGAAPRPVKIGRATCWVWSEVQAFIAARIRQSRAPR
ncbi:MAG: helix-turn-helix transcriptional regulator [Rhizobacter sp.]